MAKKFYYGGQAVIEGVMMRGRKAAVTVVRQPGGGLVQDIRALEPLYTGWLRKTPFLRGVVVLIEALVLGIRSLLYSANVSLKEEGEEISGKMVWGLLAVSLLFAVALFFVAPLFLTRWVTSGLGSSLLFNLVEGIIRLAVFLLYLKLVTLLPDIKRVFAYHGAEHMTVNAYEHGEPLEVSSVKSYATAHTRCGTSFLFVVLVIAILVFTLVGRPPILWLVLSRIILVPVIASLSYEVLYFGAGHHSSPLVRAVLAPGLWIQKLTTRQPDESQIEVAVEALKKAVELDAAQEAA